MVTKVTLDLQPAFTMQQEVYQNLPLPQLEANFDAITSHAYSVSLFLDWQQDGVSRVWLKRRLTNDQPLPVAPDFFGATRGVPGSPPPDQPCRRSVYATDGGGRPLA
ncbi:MAG: hypothetical protein R3E79_16220 [Caldilineaceae bacterium]